MDYQSAIAALNEGKSIYRAGWADKTALVTGDSITNANGTDKYIPTENDIYAGDWKVAAKEGRREEPKEPNAETVEAMNEIQSGGGEKFASSDALYKDLGINESETQQPVAEAQPDQAA